MNSIFRKAAVLFTLAVMIGACEPILAQAPGFEDSEDTTDTPIDGGISLLAAAGVGYGVKKYRDMRKKGTGGEGNG
jgi:hypothetical protein